MSDKPAPYWNSYKAGVGLGLVLLASFLLVGRGLGASGAATRIATYAVHKADATVHGGTEAEATSAAMKSPYMAQYVRGPDDPFDDYLVYMLFGLLVGGFVSGIMDGRFSFEITRGPNTTNRRRLVLAVVGGMIAAFGARMARGCTSGQALTGGASLALGSWAFMLAVFAAV